MSTENTTVLGFSASVPRHRLAVVGGEHWKQRCNLNVSSLCRADNGNWSGPDHRPDLEMNNINMLKLFTLYRRRGPLIPCTKKDTLRIRNLGF